MKRVFGNRTMKALITILITVTLLVTSSCSGGKEGDNYTAVSSDDAGMNEAIAKAKATSDDFVRALHARRPGTKDFFVKKPYPTPSGSWEHMWIEVTDEHQGVLEGIVANEAEDTHEVKIGQKVSFKITEISDWKYQDEKKLIGGYTIRYFLDKMSPEEREAFLKEAGFEL
jgi:uncharacterized protein YegJ (DUF2314 family)